MFKFPIALLSLTIGVLATSFAAVLGTVWFELIHPAMQDRLVTISCCITATLGIYTWFVVSVTRSLGGPRIHLQPGTASACKVTPAKASRAQLEQMVAMLKHARDAIHTKNRELEILANEDALTGCMNRRALVERIGAAWSDSLERQVPLSCMMIDNDHFKQINDTYGHTIGDEVLRRVGHVLIARLAGRGSVFRYGGEEFCVVLPGVPSYEAAQIGEAMRGDIEAIRLDEYKNLHISASFGVADSLETAHNADDLINHADQRLYIAKQRGRNCVVSVNRSDDESQRRQDDVHVDLLADERLSWTCSPT